MEESEEEEDKFAALIIPFCKPTESQESKLRNCPLSRESENFSDAFTSSSPDPTPPNPTPIVMVSLPESSDNHPDAAVYLTPPEHHLHSNLSSSEDQNVEEVVDLGDGSKKDEVFEDTMPVGETEEVVVVESQETEEVVVVGDTEVIDLDSDDDLGRGNDVEMQGVVELKKDGGVLENRELEEDDIVNKVEKACANRQVDEILDGCRKSREIRVETGGGFSKVVDVTNDGKASNEDGNRGGLGIEGIDKFKYVAEGDVGRRRKGKSKRDFHDDGGKRELPATIKGKEKSDSGRGSVKIVETKRGGLFDFLDVLKVVSGDRKDECKDVDFLETAKRRGLVFPAPRWWPPDGDDEDDDDGLMAEKYCSSSSVEF